MMAYMVYVSKYEKPTNIVDTSKNAPNTKKNRLFLHGKKSSTYDFVLCFSTSSKKVTNKMWYDGSQLIEKKKAPHQTKNYVVIHGPETQKKKKKPNTQKWFVHVFSPHRKKKKSFKTKKILWYVMISSLKKKSQTQKKIWCEVFIVVLY